MNLLREEDRWDEVVDHCDQAVRFHPAPSEAYVLRAMTHLLLASRTGVVDRPLLRARLVADLASAQRFGRVEPEVLAMWRDVVAGLSFGEG
ncbi:hypothetical protein ABIA33_004639 [Streptacidiphilus sp. MAP12-16]|uniref:hypothetical protein n=1 Tax=Streptacidiphilus sp. MAP12-16 TaxID=3156300 RepID=UPI003513C141